MIILKTIILLIIFLASFSVGKLISNKYKNRVRELKSFKEACNILEAKIKFTYEPIGDIFSEISNILGRENNLSQIFSKAVKNLKFDNVKNSWDSAVDMSRSNLSLNKEDISVIKGLGNLLRKNRCRRTSKRNKNYIRFCKYATFKSRRRM